MRPKIGVSVILPLLIAVMFAGCLDVAGQDAGPAPVAHHPPDIGLDAVGTGWASYDLTLDHDASLTFTITHDTLRDLCDFTPAGRGIYDRGNHTFVSLWRLGDDPYLQGQWFLFAGTPYHPFWPYQTGACGISEAVKASAGDRLRLVVATTVAGFHINVTTGEGAPVSRQALPLAPATNHERVVPEPTAVTNPTTSVADAAVGKEWGAAFALEGPALLFICRWTHSHGTVMNDSSYGHATLREVGFDGGESYRETPLDLPPPRFGFGHGLTTDTGGVDAGIGRSAGLVEAYLREHVGAAAYTGAYERGAYMISVPLGPDT